MYSLFSWFSFTLSCIGLAALLGFTMLLRMLRQNVKWLVPTDPVTDKKRYGYLLLKNQEAKSLGMVGPQWYRYKSALLRRLRVAIWISEDSHVISAISQGSILFLPGKETELLSRIDPKRVLNTVDVGFAKDMLEIIEFQQIDGADLYDLMAKHLALLDYRTSSPLPMTTRPVLLGYEAIERERVQRLVDSGLAIWLDGEYDAWRHTVVGSYLSYRNDIRAFFWRNVREGVQEGVRQGWTEEGNTENTSTNETDER